MKDERMNAKRASALRIESGGKQRRFKRGAKGARTALSACFRQFAAMNARTRLSTLLLVAVLFGCMARLGAGELGSSVIVIFNTREPESKRVAEHYAQKRQVPTNQIFGFELPQTESMTRSEYVDGLQKPLLKTLEAKGIFKLAAHSASNSGGPPLVGRRVVESSIRYAVLCYGVPTKILRDTTLVEPSADRLPAELRRNEASVDSQLACLPVSDMNVPWAGPITSPFYAMTNAALFQPSNGILMVSRLDGPTAEIARRLVDKAMEAEENGLWGRAYFDARGISNGGYKVGDDMMRGASNATRQAGYEIIMDDKPETFPASFPMSQIAFYAGWYDGNVSGPFTRPEVEFMPGAFAYHLHSFSAQKIRTTTENWVGPLLNKGATATMGCVDEPYLSATPDMAVFFSRFMYFGFSFGEAAWAAQNSLSWQNIAIGDPLYRPFGKSLKDYYLGLEKKQSKLIEWSHLMMVDRNLNIDPDPTESIGYLEGLPVTRKSAVLKEKLAGLYWAKKKLSDALDTYTEVLKLDPTPQQRVRVMLTLAEKRELYGPDSTALALYQQFLKEYPNYPDQLSIYKRMLPLARRLDRKSDVEHYEKEINRLTPAPAPQKT
jgi:uncharacterized protein (TIGR03790 family)